MFNCAAKLREEETFTLRLDSISPESEMYISAQPVLSQGQIYTRKFPERWCGAPKEKKHAKIIIKGEKHTIVTARGFLFELNSKRNYVLSH